MNKQNWLNEAIEYIDTMNSEEFESFLESCIPHYNQVKTDYAEVQFQSALVLSEMTSINNFPNSLSLAA